MAQNIDNGVLQPFSDTHGWSSDGVEKVDEPHPNATPTEEEIEEILDFLAEFDPELAAWLLIGLPIDFMLEVGGQV